MNRVIANAVLIALAINTTWFVAYSAGLGIRGLLAGERDAVSRVFLGNGALPDIAIGLHMVAGALVTVGAPLQALPALRRRWPGLHRRAGYGLMALAVVTGFGGLVYIAAEGTVGGRWMSLWFAIYGVALVWAAVNTVYYGIDKDLLRHSAWAVRFVILAVGSWIFRMHYVIWEILTGGAASNEDFTGAFDRVQVVAFFVPYLLLAELFLRRRTSAGRGPG